MIKRSRKVDLGREKKRMEDKIREGEERRGEGSVDEDDDGNVNFNMTNQLII